MKVVLEDVLEPGLSVVFCGTAVGAASARRGKCYAGPGNLLWKPLFEVGLTPWQFEPAEFPKLLGLWFGLTDLAKMVSATESMLRKEDLVPLLSRMHRGRKAVDRPCGAALCPRGGREKSGNGSRRIVYGFERLDLGVRPSASLHLQDIPRQTRARPGWRPLSNPHTIVRVDFWGERRTQTLGGTRNLTQGPLTGLTEAFSYPTPPRHNRTPGGVG